MADTTPIRVGSLIFTSARLSLGRTAPFVSTRDRLEFQLDHARARDAVHHLVDFQPLVAALNAQGVATVLLESAIPPLPPNAPASAARQSYLRRPDLGRRLAPASADHLREQAINITDQPQATVIVADGLSALAVERHALLLLDALTPHLPDWRKAPVAIVRNARVAIGDEIGEILQAELTILLIGERPGLTAPDSLGVYLTYRPRLGRTDADRNCISNIRLEGLDYEEAAQRIAFYANSARALGRSGFELKQSSSPKLPPVR